jgi:hypothetical protein
VSDNYYEISPLERHKINTANIFTEYCLFDSLHDENLAYGTGFNANESKRKRDSEGGRLNYAVTTNAKGDMRGTNGGRYI